MTLHSSVTMLNRDNNMFNFRTLDCLSPAVGRGGGGGAKDVGGSHGSWGNGGGLFVADQQISKGGDHGNLITN